MFHPSNPISRRRIFKKTIAAVFIIGNKKWSLDWTSTKSAWLVENRSQIKIQSNFFPYFPNSMRIYRGTVAAVFITGNRNWSLDLTLTKSARLVENLSQIKIQSRFFHIFQIACESRSCCCCIYYRQWELITRLNLN